MQQLDKGSIVGEGRQNSRICPKVFISIEMRPIRSVVSNILQFYGSISEQLNV